ncbi:hypothetical protein [Aeromonas enteropelogenes]
MDSEHTEASLWDQYEQRKQALQQWGLNNHEYEQAVRQIADELGV